MSGNTPLGSMVINIGLDMSELSGSVTGLNRQMRLVNSSINNNLSALGKHGDKTKRLETLTEGLSEKQKIQQAIVDEQAEAYKRVVEEKGATAKESENLATKLNKEQTKLNDITNQLKELQREQDIANSSWTKFGDELSTAGGILENFGGGLQSFGNKMTKYVTTPILGAVSALGGFVAYQGWNRLVAMDNAEARLRGMGYDTEEVMPDVRKGVTGTTLTSAEGANIAAGALPAGIAEGEELQDYIKLVDSFKIASGRSADDAALIMNRVVGGGRLMTGELNQIEDALPGFTKSMADAMGVSVNDFREMVTQGEVSSEQFLTSLEGYAGPISEEYAKTWEGIKANVKSNIGIIGETALSGVFDTAKEELSGFLDFLRNSDELQEFATKINEFLTKGIEKLVSGVKSLINWWNEADDGTRKMTLGFIGFLVALGPVLTVVGTGIVMFGTLLGSLGTIATAIGKAGGLFKGLGGIFKVILSPFKLLLKPLFTLGSRLLFLAGGPIGLIIGAITLLAGAFYVAYQRSETFRNIVDGVVQKLKDAWKWISDFAEGVFSLFKGDDEKGTDILESLGLSRKRINQITGWVDRIKTTFNNVKNAVTDAWNWVKTFTEGLITLFRGDEEEGAGILSRLGLSDETVEKITDFVDTVKDTWASLKETISEAWDSIKESVKRIGNTMSDIHKKYIKPLIEDGIEKLGDAWEWLKEKVSDFLDFLGLEMPSMDDIIGGAFTAASTYIDIFKEYIEALLKTVTRVFDGVSKAFEKIGEGDWKGAWEEVKSMFGDIGEIWGEAWGNIKEMLSERFGETIESAKQWAIDLWDKVKEWFGKKSGEVLDTVVGWYNSVLEWWDDLKTKASDKTSEMWDSVKEWFKTKTAEVVATLIKWYLNVLGWWDDLKSNISTKTRELWDSVKTWFVNKSEEILNTIRGWVGSLVTRFNRLKRDGIQAIKDLWSKGKEWFGSLKTDGIKLAKELVDGAVGWFEDLPDKLKEALDAAGNWLDRMRTTLGDKAAALGRNISRRVIGALNTFIGGINTVANLLGLGKQLITPIFMAPEASVSGGAGNTGQRISRYSKGTNYHRGGLALVGDKGPGNSPGGSGIADNSTTSELIRLPNRKEFLADGDALLDLPIGSKVLNNKDTRDELKKRMLGAELGGGTDDDGKLTGWDAWKYLWKNDKIGDAAKAAKGVVEIQVRKDMIEFGNFVADVWDYARNPGALVQNLLGNLNFGSGWSNEMLSLAMGSVNSLAGTATDFVKGLFDRSNKVDGKHILGKSISHYFGKYNAKPGSILYGQPHYGLDTRHNYDTLRSPINGEVTRRFYDQNGGNMLQIKNGDLTWWFAHLSSMAKNRGDRVKIGDKLGVTGNTGNFTTGAHLHTQVMKNGVGNSYAFDPLPLLKGEQRFATGGLVGHGLYELGEEGYPEWIIPTDPSRANDAMKLIAHAGKTLRRNKGTMRPNNLPNVDMSDDKNMKKLLEHIIEQTEDTKKVVDLLAQIVAKDYVALYNEKKLAKDIAPEVSRRINKQNDRELRFN